MDNVVTKQISNSITVSLDNERSLADVQLAGFGILGRNGHARPVENAKADPTAARTSGGFKLAAERHRGHMSMMFDVWRDATRRDHVVHGFLTPAAAGRDAQLELELIERFGAFRDGGANLPVGYGLAHADNHDGSTVDCVMRIIIIRFWWLGKSRWPLFCNKTG
jgi:hypothetical protein